MALKSSVLKLPAGVRAELHRLLADGHLTLDEMVGEVRAMGGDVSRSALHRYQVNFEEQGRKLREARETAEVFVRELGSEPDSKTGRLVKEIVETLAFRLGSRALTDEADLDSKDLMQLAKTLDHLERSDSIRTARELKLREELRGKVADRLDAGEMEFAKADTPAARAAVLERIRQDVYGIFD